MGILENNETKYVRIEPCVKISELSSTEYYVGTSVNSCDTTTPAWRIKKIWKIGGVWYIGFPEGDQTYAHAWDSRLTFSYK